MSNIEKINVGGIEYNLVDALTVQLVCDNVESGTTASKSYSVGEYLVQSDTLYKVIASITSGDTLTVGTNIQETNVGEELTQINENQIKSLYKKITVGNVTANHNISLGTISEITNGKVTTKSLLKGIGVIASGGSSYMDYGVQAFVTDGNLVEVTPTITQAGFLVELFVLY